MKQSREIKNTVSLRGDKNVLTLTVMIIVQFCEYIKIHWIMYFKCVNYECESYHNKAVTKWKKNRRRKYTLRACKKEGK